ncbi:hypothetical protein M1O57_03035 [Dehalococcoidia bacterium]|nr:hypothetical protein [Dehalococcoidia bacterium]
MANLNLLSRTFCGRLFFTRGDHPELLIAGLTQARIIAVVTFLIAISVFDSLLEKKPGMSR